MRSSDVAAAATACCELVEPPVACTSLAVESASESTLLLAKYAAATGVQLSLLYQRHCPRSGLNEIVRHCEPPAIEQ